MENHNSEANTEQTSGTQTEKTTENKRRRHAAVKFPPPAIFVLLILLGFALGFLMPLGTGLPPALAALGYVFVAAGIAIALIVAGAFKRANTAIEPWKPTTSLVTDGLYAWSRNPIYAGFCLFNLGVGIAANNLWIVLSIFAGAWLVYKVAIEKEERYLEREFGQEYLDYKTRVRRWL
jgi:protein-S-isoprenylcysteine O-methyltransferase Ste14